MFESKGKVLKKNKVFFNGNIYTQGGNNYIADSMATSGNIIVAVGRNLEKDDDFKNFQKVDLKGLTVLPGFIDAHTHFYFMALWLNTVHLDGLKSLEEVLSKIKAHSKKLGRNEWVTGVGFSPDRWNKYIMPDKLMLDKITDGRPAAIYSKDQHILWANSKALEITGINYRTPDPEGGVIDRSEKREPSGILRENPAILQVLRRIRGTDEANITKLYRRALKIAYSKGVTGVHSFDDWHAFPYLNKFATEGKLGLRMNYYVPVKYLPELKKIGIRYGYGDDYLRVSGIKIFADGSLGSQTALCFKKYIGLFRESAHIKG
jgi:predicted amidohydrolase YtcJ